MSLRQQGEFLNSEVVLEDGEVSARKVGGGTETNLDTLIALLLLCVGSCMFGLDLHVVGGARKGGCCQLLLWRIDTS